MKEHTTIKYRNKTSTVKIPLNEDNMMVLISEGYELVL
jgi:hypothetical protein